MAEEIKTITEKANILSRDKAKDLTNVETFEGEKTDGTPVRVPKSLIASAADVSELSLKVEGLDEDCVHKTTIEDVEYDGSVDGQPVAELKTALNSHTSNTSNPHSVTKAQIGLGNVDNTSDTNKPISTATQEAINSEATARQSADETLQDNIDKKQDTISDLSTIRSNASAGAALVGNVSYYTVLS